MNTRQFQGNRAAFPAGELAKYRGQWIAFSGDGQRIVGSAADLERLEEELAALGEDPQQVLLEYIPGPEDDISLGGAETL